MEIFKEKESLAKYLRHVRNSRSTIGLVPTMGALHQGHISLFETSLRNNEVTVGTIFVNPLQFNNASDLDAYPNTIETDLEKLENTGVQAVFIPSREEMYAEKPLIRMSFGVLEEVMEGQFRPGHFNGVSIVVAKLFHLIAPDKAYFGQKDLQQFLIIQQMVKDLSFPIELICCPVIREKDGLAMSSRNVRIPEAKRAVAAYIYKSLQQASAQLHQERPDKIKKEALAFLSSFPELRPEYFEIADGETLAPVTEMQNHQQIAICAAVWLEEVRLVDNVVIKTEVRSQKSEV